LLKSVKLSKSSAIYVLLIFAPIAAALEVVHADHLVLFLVSAIALIPLAKLIGDSTEHLATHYGPTVGSLLNVTFGNAAEIIIGVVAISAGLLDLVKASITGAIIGNILLIFGLSVIVGGFRYKELSFSRENIGVQSSMLFLAIIGLAIPTILANTVLSTLESQEQVQLLSDALAFILLIVYIIGIVFTFITHKHLFTPPESANDVQESHGTHWSKKKSFLLLPQAWQGS
jgi:Ca2+:H+ antiporter